jgi:hypothetical protein
LLVFVEPGRLTDEHDGGVGVSLSRYRSRLAGAQLAVLAARDLLLDLFEVGSANAGLQATLRRYDLAAAVCPDSGRIVAPPKTSVNEPQDAVIHS